MNEELNQAADFFEENKQGGYLGKGDFLQYVSQLTKKFKQDQSQSISAVGDEWEDRKQFTNKQVMEMLTDFGNICKYGKYVDIPNDAAEFISDRTGVLNNPEHIIQGKEGK